MSWEDVTFETDRFLALENRISPGTAVYGGAPLPLRKLIAGVPLYDVTLAWIKYTWGDYENMPFQGKISWCRLLAVSRGHPGNKKEILKGWSQWLASDSARTASPETKDGLIPHRPSEPPTDEPLSAEPENGPKPPYWLLWKDQDNQLLKFKIGHRRFNLTWRLLKYFWDCDAASFDELQGPGKPWPNPVSVSTISTAINRFKNENWPHDFPWKLVCCDGKVKKMSC
jgi:hypothetical protein